MTELNNDNGKKLMERQYEIKRTMRQLHPDDVERENSYTWHIVRMEQKAKEICFEEKAI